MNRGPRTTAIDILRAWEGTATPVDSVMERHLERAAMHDPRDRHLTKALVYGILRRRTYLDWVAGRFSNQPLTRLHPLVLQALRVGLLQLLFLDRIPASAAINETVQALRLHRQPKWLTGFVNGVLRTASRATDIPDPRQAQTPLPETARLCHPDWLVTRWKQRFGTEATTTLCGLNNSEPRLCLRVNSTRTTMDDLAVACQQQGFSPQPGRYAPDAFYLPDFQGQIQTLPGFDAGNFQVQDEAAQLIPLLLLPWRPNAVYLDACAGLGGKTSQIRQMLPSNCRLLAVEPNPSRLRLLADNLQRLRCRGRVTVIGESLQGMAQQNAESFAGILVDAPCSGLGVIRRHPDIRWNRCEADLPRYQALQLELLRTAAPLVQHGGVLVYATCSLEPEENIEVVENFLNGHNDFLLTAANDVLPPAAMDLVDDHGCLQTRPDLHGLDGFFAARLVRR